MECWCVFWHSGRERRRGPAHAYGKALHDEIQSVLPSLLVERRQRFDYGGNCLYDLILSHTYPRSRKRPSLELGLT